MDSLRQPLESFRNGGVVRYRLIIAPVNVPLRRTGYAGSPKAIGQVPGIARGRDMAQGSWGVMRSGSGAKCGRGRGDALPLLLKCERGMWWILKQSSNSRIQSLLKMRFRLRVGLGEGSWSYR